MFFSSLRYNNSANVDLRRNPIMSELNKTSEYLKKGGYKKIHELINDSHQYQKGVVRETLGIRVHPDLKKYWKGKNFEINALLVFYMLHKIPPEVLDLKSKYATNKRP